MSTTFEVPTELQDKYSALKDQMEKLKEEMKQAASDFFKEATSALFAKYPELGQFSWRQYTPYFNDGDSCEFSVHNDYINFVYDGEEVDDFDGYNEEIWDSGYKKRIPNPTPPTEAEKCGTEILELLSQFDEDFYLQAFGDHVEVTVNQNGATTDECSHD